MSDSKSVHPHPRGAVEDMMQEHYKDRQQPMGHSERAKMHLARKARLEKEAEDKS